MSELAWLTLSEASELLRNKKLSPVEYAKALIGRIETHDKKLNAFLRFTPEIALEDARRAEAEIGRGEWRRGHRRDRLSSCGEGSNRSRRST
ncbi:MAG: hypothetical protein ACXW2A_07875 [Burkholderiales bacterium]